VLSGALAEPSTSPPGATTRAVVDEVPWSIARMFTACGPGRALTIERNGDRGYPVPVPGRPAVACSPCQAMRARRVPSRRSTTSSGSEVRSSAASHGRCGHVGFLHPSLSEQEDRLKPVIDDVRRVILMDAGEVAALLMQTLSDNDVVLLQSAHVLRESFEHCRKLLALSTSGDSEKVMAAEQPVRSSRTTS